MSNNSLQEIVLAAPRGFCAGVDRAIDIVDRALEKFGSPVYVRHEIVHNTFVVADLKSRGAIFIEDLADVPAGATLVFSAHGVPKAVEEEAARRGFHVFDATCPLVTKVHVEVAKLHKEGFDFGVAFVANHDELETLFVQLGHFHVHLGHQRTGRVKHVEAASRRFFFYRLGHTVGAEHQRGARGHIGQVFNEDGATVFEVSHHKGVVHDFVTHIHGCAKFF